MHNSGQFIGFVASAASLLLGCSAILGIGDLPAPADGGPGGASSSGSGGPGDGSGSSSGSGATDGGGPDVSGFLGTWQTTGGTQTLSNCTNASNDGVTQIPTTIALMITTGTTSDLVGTYTGPGSSGCVIAMNVSGQVATGVVGQTCTQVAQGQTDVVRLDTYTFTISGNTAHEVGTATEMDQAATNFCDVAGDATYAKM